jgi:hypothetical protein
VEEITLGAFANGREIWVRPDAPALFDRLEVITRARSRLGENCYRLLTNNCRHFCEWCRHGDGHANYAGRSLAKIRHVMRRCIVKLVM